MPNSYFQIINPGCLTLAPLKVRQNLSCISWSKIKKYNSFTVQSLKQSQQHILSLQNKSLFIDNCKLQLHHKLQLHSQIYFNTSSAFDHNIWVDSTAYRLYSQKYF